MAKQLKTGTGRFLVQRKRALGLTDRRPGSSLLFQSFLGMNSFARWVDLTNLIFAGDAFALYKPVGIQGLGKKKLFGHGGGGGLGVRNCQMNFLGDRGPRFSSASLQKTHHMVVLGSGFRLDPGAHLLPFNGRGIPAAALMGLNQGRLGWELNPLFGADG